MRPSALRIAALLPLALLTACAEEDHRPVPAATPAAPTSVASTPPDMDFSAFNQGEIPAERPKGDLSGLPPEPDKSAPLAERIAWEALEAVTDFADRVDPEASASCPDISGEIGEAVTCTVDFFGKRYNYKILVMDGFTTGLSDGQNESGYLSYTADLVSAPIMRDRIESIVRYQYDTEYAICDMDDHAQVPFTEHNTEPSPTGGTILATGIECRALDTATGAVTTIELELLGSGSPVFPQSSY